MWRRRADPSTDGSAPDDAVAKEMGAIAAQAPGARIGSRSASELEARRRDRRSDLTVAALGVTLGLICALFPWYIFFNPDEFGVRAVRFGGGGTGSEPIMLGAQSDRIGAPVDIGEVPPLKLDLLSTGTAARESGAVETGSITSVDQPFPPPLSSFRVVQIANGRAMLEDDSGLFVVQPGSLLPDMTRVEAIEEHDGRQVLVTDKGARLAPE